MMTMPFFQVKTADAMSEVAFSDERSLFH